MGTHSYVVMATLNGFIFFWQLQAGHKQYKV